jgi:hypothetical protein
MQKCILNQQEASKWQFPVDFDRVSHIVDYRNYTRSLAKDLKVLLNFLGKLPELSFSNFQKIHNEVI